MEIFEAKFFTLTASGTALISLSTRGQLTSALSLYKNSSQGLWVPLPLGFLCHFH